MRYLAFVPLFALSMAISASLLGEAPSDSATYRTTFRGVHNSIRVLDSNGCASWQPPDVVVDSLGLHAGSEWQEEFGLAGRTLEPTGRNPFFILEPGYRLTFAGEDEKLSITVLDETVKVGEVTVRVVEEREWENGELIEVSRNFFAICKETGDVFYFGEDVDNYRDGKIIGHDGVWRADQPDNKPGLIMPGSPEIGMKYYQEIAPGVAMDRAEVIDLTTSLKTPAGTFEACLKIREGSALKPREKEFKIYAPGVGLIQDADLLLTSHGFSE